jgi:hypothetical protein
MADMAAKRFSSGLPSGPDRESRDERTRIELKFKEFAQFPTFSAQQGERNARESAAAIRRLA